MVYLHGYVSVSLSVCSCMSIDIVNPCLSQDVSPGDRGGDRGGKASGGAGSLPLSVIMSPEKYLHFHVSLFY